MKSISYILTSYLIFITINIFGQKSQNYFIPYERDTVFMFENPKSKITWSENNYGILSKHYTLLEQKLYFYNEQGKQK